MEYKEWKQFRKNAWRNEEMSKQRNADRNLEINLKRQKKIQYSQGENQKWWNKRNTTELKETINAVVN